MNNRCVLPFIRRTSYLHKNYSPVTRSYKNRFDAFVFFTILVKLFMSAIEIIFIFMRYLFTIKFISYILCIEFKLQSYIRIVKTRMFCFSTKNYLTKQVLFSTTTTERHKRFDLHLYPKSKTLS